MTQLRLYGSYTSPYVRHCRIAVIEQGLECEFRQTDNAQSDLLSPTKRVPFLEDGALVLRDSASILMHLRRKSGRPLFADPAEYDQFCLANTVMDTAANLFMLEKDGVHWQDYPYLGRQHERIATTLAELDRMPLPLQPPYTDAQIRLACVLDWALYRKRFTLNSLPNLSSFLEGTRQYEPFTQTAPPA